MTWRFISVPTHYKHDDIVCPMTTAWELSKNWPEAKLIVAPSSGHTAFEKEITHELIKATNGYA